MTTNVGLDRDSLDMMLTSLDDFVAQELPDNRMLELDHEDVCPEDTVRAMCGDALGVQLVFIPEEYGGWAAAPSTPTGCASGWPASTSAWPPRSSPPSSAATRS